MNTYKKVIAALAVSGMLNSPSLRWRKSMNGRFIP